MNGTPKEMANLSRAAINMRTGNHGRYLAELMRWYRHASSAGAIDAADSLDFLVALWKTPLASRVDELVALNDVGRWLEERLLEDPGMSAERLAWQIGWLRRIAHSEEALYAKGPTQDASAGRREQRHKESTRTFGTRGTQIRDMREQATRTPAKVGASGTERIRDASSTLDLGALLRTVDKNNAAAKVPEVLKAVPAPQRAAVAREILKKIDRKWVDARKDKAWAAELLALASVT